jgi:hypothetical protein
MTKNMAVTATAMITVAAQPKILCPGVATKGHIRRRLVATTIIAAMIGTEMTPLTTAL